MRSDDLTAAAKIRDAAMNLFGERGEASVTVRDIAAAAGVSPGLVIHHYKSKDGLKAAVDERALSMLKDMLAKSSDPQASANSTAQSMSQMTDAFADEIAQFPTLLPYLRRLLVDGGDSTAALFRSMFEATRDALSRMQSAGLVARTNDEDARAAFLLVNDLGAVILREQITDVLGVDPMSPDGIVRWGTAVLEAYSEPVYLPPKKSRPNKGKP
ncbi:MAG: TetR family transcriptional regulator [Jatrophihabitantaceae bacterium]